MPENYQFYQRYLLKLDSPLQSTVLTISSDPGQVSTFLTTVIASFLHHVLPVYPVWTHYFCEIYEIIIFYLKNLCWVPIFPGTLYVFSLLLRIMKPLQPGLSQSHYTNCLSPSHLQSTHTKSHALSWTALPSQALCLCTCYFLWQESSAFFSLRRPPRSP